MKIKTKSQDERKSINDSCEAKKVDPNLTQAEPVAAPAPSMDSKKPIENGNEAVEKFMVATDTNGGD